MCHPTGSNLVWKSLIWGHICSSLAILTLNPEFQCIRTIFENRCGSPNRVQPGMKIIDLGSCMSYITKLDHICQVSRFYDDSPKFRMQRVPVGVWPTPTGPLWTDHAHLRTYPLDWPILYVYQISSQSVQPFDPYRVTDRRTDRQNGYISPGSG